MKGRLVYVAGRLSIESWKEGERTREQACVVAKTLQFLDRPKEAAEES